MQHSYTKKPVTIQAFQHKDISGETTPRDAPVWILSAAQKTKSTEGALWFDGGALGRGLLITTLEGTLSVSDGDWIIQGVKGEIYPCKPDIFEETYSKAVLVPDAIDEPLPPSRPMRNLSFSDVVEGIKNGERFAREGWNGKDMFIFLVPGSQFAVNRDPLLSILGEGTKVNYNPHIDIKQANGSVSTWSPSNGDTLAEDWIIVE